MPRCIIIIIVAIALLTLASATSLLHATAAPAGNYTAAAVQFSPKTSISAQADQIIQVNLEGLDLLVASAAKQGAQIVVLSEGSSGMYGALSRRERFAEYCEAVQTGSTPCDDPKQKGNQQLQAFSSMARRYKTVLVAHMCDVVACTPGAGSPVCPADARFLYNTQVAFNENGTIMAKYHKAHLFGEIQSLNQPLAVPVYFDTSFGIRFGMIICFDVEFDAPVAKLLALGIRHFVYSSSWSNYAPAFIATQFQQAFSRISSSNMIAANTGNSPSSFGGGVWSSGEPVNVYFNQSDFAVKTVLVATLPAVPRVVPALVTPSTVSSASDVATKANIQPCRLYDILGDCYLFTPSVNATVSAMVSNGGLDCTAQMKATNVTAGEVFALMAFKGVRTFDYTVDKLQTEMCLFLRCYYKDGTTPLVCQRVRQSFTTWSSVRIQARGLSPQLMLLPFYSIDDGQVRPVSDLLFATSDGGVNAAVATSSKIATDTIMYSVALYNVGKPTNETTIKSNNHVAAPWISYTN